MKVIILRILIGSFCLIFMFGCNSLASEREKFPYDLMIGLSDLTNDYEYRDSGFEKVDGEKSFYLSYGKKSGELGALISHQIAIYPDIESAKSSIPTWENKLFTNKWSQPEESKFRPSDPEDFYLLKCLPTQINDRESQGCSILQQHKNLIILIIVNIDSGNMSFSEFDGVLEKLDSRLPTEIVPTPQE